MQNTEFVYIFLNKDCTNENHMIINVQEMQIKFLRIFIAIQKMYKMYLMLCFK